MPSTKFATESRTAFRLSEYFPVSLRNGPEIPVFACDGILAVPVKPRLLNSRAELLGACDLLVRRQERTSGSGFRNSNLSDRNLGPLTRKMLAEPFCLTSGHSNDQKSFSS